MAPALLFLAVFLTAAAAGADEGPPRIYTYRGPGDSLVFTDRPREGAHPIEERDQGERLEDYHRFTPAPSGAPIHWWTYTPECRGFRRHGEGR